MAKKYGMPYKGSKSKIAEDIVDILPASDWLADLFAGGCAITHCALLSGKWKHVLANDINGSTMVFMDAINGEYKEMATVLDRQGYFAARDNDLALALIYSFGNGIQHSYLWGKDIEPVKVAASRMLAAPSMHERRTYYREFIRALDKYIKEHGALPGGRTGKECMSYDLERLQNLERLESMENDELGNLSISTSDYRDVPIPAGATVYCDPPYLDDERGYTKEHFDYEAFYEWLSTRDYPVFVSELTAPPGFTEIWHKGIQHTINADHVNRVVEKLLVQDRYAEQFKDERLFNELHV